MNIKQTLTIRPDKQRSKRVENNRLEEKSISSSKLNGVVGAIELPNDFDEKIEIRAYFESKHL